MKSSLGGKVSEMVFSYPFSTRGKNDTPPGRRQGLTLAPARTVEPPCLA